MKSFLALLIVICSACTQKKVSPQPEPAFANTITVKQRQITLTGADTEFLKKAQIMRLYYYRGKKDSGFVYRTLDLGCYTVAGTDFTGHQNRKTIATLPPASDIFIYGDTLYEYNTKTKILKPFMTDVIMPGSNEIHMLSKAGDYSPMLPYNSNRLIKLSGQFKFIYNYTAKKSTKPNFIDISPFIIVADSGRYEKTGSYPAVFFKEELCSNEAYFTIDSSSNIFYIFPWLDTVYKINARGQELSKAVLHHFPVREKYNSDKSADLAYVRKYEMTNEKNLSIALCRNNYIVVVKQLSRQQILGESAHKIFIYNTALEKLYSSEIPVKVIPQAFPNNNGFLIFSADFKKVFCYELP